MRRILWPLGLISILAFAASTFTTNYNLEKPADGDTSWGDALRDNMDTIDTQMSVTATDVSNHIADTTDAHDASAISTIAATLCNDTDAQGFLDCLDAATYAIQQNYVTTDTSQVITGSKSFNSLQVLNGGMTVNGPLVFSDVGTGVVHSNGGTLSGSAIVNADVDAAAAIAYSKLNLASSIVSGDITDGTIANADISASAAIAYSKLNLGSSITSSDITNGTIVDADISGSAAIARSKIATGTASHVLINDGSGNLSSEAQLALTRGGTGINAASTTALFNGLDPLTTKADIIVHNGTDSIRLPVGSNGQVLTADSTTASGLKWAAGGGGGGGGAVIGDAVSGSTGGTVLFTDATGDLQEDTTSFLWNNTNKELSLSSTTIGTGNTLSVAKTISTSTGTVNAAGSFAATSNQSSGIPTGRTEGLVVSATNSASVSHSGATRGIDITSTISGSAGKAGGVTGILNTTEKSSTSTGDVKGITNNATMLGGSSGDLYGFNNVVSSAGATFGTAYGIYNDLTVDNWTGTPTAYGQLTSVTYGPTAGTITNIYGHRIDVSGLGATATNTYGLYIGSDGGGSTIARALHVNSGTSYFGGDVLFSNTSNKWDNTNKNISLSSTVDGSGTAIGSAGVLSSRTATLLNNGATGVAGLAEKTTASGGNIQGVYGQSTATSDVSIASGVRAKVINNATTTNGIGLYVESPTNTGTFTNYYGLYLTGASGGTVTTNNRALHVQAGESYFGGDLKINGLTASEAVATDANKNLVSVAGVSATELGYLSTVTSDVQTQINGKASTALSNLSSVAINTSLLSDTDNTDDLGSTTVRWQDIYAATMKDAADKTQINLTNRQLYDDAATPKQALDWQARVLKDTAGTSVFYWGSTNQSAATIRPTATNTYDLGNSTNSWANVYLTSNKFLGTTSGTLTLTAPATITTHTLTLPSAQGSAKQGLENDGSGNLSWSNHVTSAVAGERIERAVLTTGSSPTITSQSGSWIASGSGSTGNTTWTINGGIFSSTPTCVCSSATSGGLTIMRTCTAFATSSTSLTTYHYVMNSGSATLSGDGNSISIICQGPR